MLAEVASVPCGDATCSTLGRDSGEIWSCERTCHSGKHYLIHGRLRIGANVCAFHGAREHAANAGGGRKWQWRMGTIDVGNDSGAAIALVSGAGRRRRAAARLIPVVIALVATYALLIVVAMVTTSFNGRQLDFSVYYAAEAALRANPHANIYDPSVLASAARAVPGCKLWPGAAYPYLPMLAILMLPLGALPFDAAVHVWMLFNLALWVVDTALLVYWLRELLSEGTAGAAGAAGAAGDGLS